jgi:hypothetical protein
MTETAINPAIFTWDGPHGLPRFEAVHDDDFKAAFDHALAAHNAEIDAMSSPASRRCSGTKPAPTPTTRSNTSNEKSRRSCRGIIRRSARMNRSSNA